MYMCICSFIMLNSLSLFIMLNSFNMLNSLSLRQTLFDGNPMNASISYQFYKTVFRSILFLTFQQLCEVDIIIFPM